MGLELAEQGLPDIRVVGPEGANFREENDMLAYSLGLVCGEALSSRTGDLPCMRAASW